MYADGSLEHASRLYFIAASLLLLGCAAASAMTITWQSAFRGHLAHRWGSVPLISVRQWTITAYRLALVFLSFCWSSTVLDAQWSRLGFITMEAYSTKRHISVARAMARMMSSELLNQLHPDLRPAVIDAATTVLTFACATSLAEVMPRLTTIFSRAGQRTWVPYLLHGHLLPLACVVIVPLFERARALDANLLPWLLPVLLVTVGQLFLSLGVGCWPYRMPKRLRSFGAPMHLLIPNMATAFVVLGAIGLLWYNAQTPAVVRFPVTAQARLEARRAHAAKHLQAVVVEEMDARAPHCVLRDNSTSCVKLPVPVPRPHKVQVPVARMYNRTSSGAPRWARATAGRGAGGG